MIKSNFNTEYRTPKCKVVNIHVACSLLSGSVTDPYGDAGHAGSNVIVDEDGEDY